VLEVAIGIFLICLGFVLGFVIGKIEAESNQLFEDWKKDYHTNARPVWYKEELIEKAERLYGTQKNKGP
jgi:hypothetical protein